MGFLLCNWMMMSLETAAVSRLSAQIFFFFWCFLLCLFFLKRKTKQFAHATQRNGHSLSDLFTIEWRTRGGTKFSLANLRVQNERNSFVISPRMNIEMGGISAKSRLREIVHAFVCPLMMKPNTHTAQPLIRAIFPHFIYFFFASTPSSDTQIFFFFCSFVLLFSFFDLKENKGIKKTTKTVDVFVFFFCAREMRAGAWLCRDWWRYNWRMSGSIKATSQRGEVADADTQRSIFYFSFFHGPIRQLGNGAHWVLSLSLSVLALYILVKRERPFPISSQNKSTFLHIPNFFFCCCFVLNENKKSNAYKKRVRIFFLFLWQRNKIRFLFFLILGVGK